MIQLLGTPIDTAFLDVAMGSMSGLELAAEIKRLQPETHIIFVTGHPKYAVNAFQIHAIGYLLKPISLEALERELTFLYEAAPGCSPKSKWSRWDAISRESNGFPLWRDRISPPICSPILPCKGAIPMNQPLFRKSSMDRVSSPEQLNDYIRVTSPGVWLVLAADIVLLMGACVWRIFGRLKKLIVGIHSLSLAVAMLAGCSNNTTPTTEPSSTPETTATQPSEPAEQPMEQSQIDKTLAPIGTFASGDTATASKLLADGYIQHNLAYGTGTDVFPSFAACSFCASCMASCLRKKGWASSVIGSFRPLDFGGAISSMTFVFGGTLKGSCSETSKVLFSKSTLRQRSPKISERRIP